MPYLGHHPSQSLPELSQRVEQASQHRVDSAPESCHQGSAWAIVTGWWRVDTLDVCFINTLPVTKPGIGL